MRFLLGVDEAGRAPLAGPVSVGFVRVPETFNVAAEFPGVADSKQLTPEGREQIFRELRRRAKNGDLTFCVRFGSHIRIDEEGITRAIAGAIARGIRYLAPDPNSTRIVLDGLLRAPKEYRQQTIINGDVLVPVISLASIAAKVVRDRLMKKMAKQFPQYGFEGHKGYPTKLHYQMIEQFGPCEIHRRSYLHLASVS